MVAPEQLDELRAGFGDVTPMAEGGVDFVFLRRLVLPEGCTPREMQALLCLGQHTGYTTRHVHLHEHRGRPRFSRTDLRENALFVPDFWNVQPSLPHGAVVFSFNSAVGQCWIPGRSSPSGVEIAIVGSPMRCTWKVTNG